MFLSESKAEENLVEIDGNYKPLQIETQGDDDANTEDTSLRGKKNQEPENSSTVKCEETDADIQSYQNDGQKLDSNQEFDPSEDGFSREGIHSEHGKINKSQELSNQSIQAEREEGNLEETSEQTPSNQQRSDVEKATEETRKQHMEKKEIEADIVTEQNEEANGVTEENKTSTECTDKSNSLLSITNEPNEENLEEELGKIDTQEGQDRKSKTRFLSESKAEENIVEIDGNHKPLQIETQEDGDAINEDTYLREEKNQEPENSSTAKCEETETVIESYQNDGQQLNSNQEFDPSEDGFSREGIHSEHGKINKHQELSNQSIQAEREEGNLEETSEWTSSNQQRSDVEKAAEETRKEHVEKEIIEDDIVTEQNEEANGVTKENITNTECTDKSNSLLSITNEPMEETLEEEVGTMDTHDRKSKIKCLSESESEENLAEIDGDYKPSQVETQEDDDAITEDSSLRGKKNQEPEKSSTEKCEEIETVIQSCEREVQKLDNKQEFVPFENGVSRDGIHNEHGKIYKKQELSKPSIQSEREHGNLEETSEQTPSNLQRSDVEKAVEETRKEHMEKKVIEEVIVTDQNEEANGVTEENITNTVCTDKSNSLLSITNEPISETLEEEVGTMDTHVKSKTRCLSESKADKNLVEIDGDYKPSQIETQEDDDAITEDSSLREKKNQEPQKSSTEKCEQIETVMQSYKRYGQKPDNDQEFVPFEDGVSREGIHSEHGKIHKRQELYKPSIQAEKEDDNFEETSERTPSNQQMSDLEKVVEETSEEHMVKETIKDDVVTEQEENIMQEEQPEKSNATLTDTQESLEETMKELGIMQRGVPSSDAGSEIPEMKDADLPTRINSENHEAFSLQPHTTISKIEESEESSLHLKRQDEPNKDQEASSTVSKEEGSEMNSSKDNEHGSRVISTRKDLEQLFSNNIQGIIRIADDDATKEGISDAINPEIASSVQSTVGKHLLPEDQETEELAAEAKKVQGENLPHRDMDLHELRTHEKKSKTDCPSKSQTEENLEEINHDYKLSHIETQEDDEAITVNSFTRGKRNQESHKLSTEKCEVIETVTQGYERDGQKHYINQEFIPFEDGVSKEGIYGEHGKACQKQELSKASIQIEREDENLEETSERRPSNQQRSDLEKAADGTKKEHAEKEKIKYDTATEQNEEANGVIKENITNIEFTDESNILLSITNETTEETLEEVGTMETESPKSKTNDDISKPTNKQRAPETKCKKHEKSDSEPQAIFERTEEREVVYTNAIVKQVEHRRDQESPLRRCDLGGNAGHGKDRVQQQEVCNFAFVKEILETADAEVREHNNQREFVVYDQKVEIDMVPAKERKVVKELEEISETTKPETSQVGEDEQPNITYLPVSQLLAARIMREEDKSQTKIQEHNGRDGSEAGDNMKQQGLDIPSEILVKTEEFTSKSTTNLSKCSDAQESAHNIDGELERSEKSLLVLEIDKEFTLQTTNEVPDSSETHEFPHIIDKEEPQRNTSLPEMDKLVEDAKEEISVSEIPTNIAPKCGKKHATAKKNERGAEWKIRDFTDLEIITNANSDNTVETEHKEITNANKAQFKNPDTISVAETESNKLVQERRCQDFDEAKSTKPSFEVLEKSIIEDCPRQTTPIIEMDNFIGIDKTVLITQEQSRPVMDKQVEGTLEFSLEEKEVTTHIDEKDAEFTSTQADTLSEDTIERTELSNVDDTHPSGSEKDSTERSNQIAQCTYEEKDLEVNKDELDKEATAATYTQVDDEKSDEYGKDEGEHEIVKSGIDALMTEDTLEKEQKILHKKSHNILSGVKSKVRHSIAKVKKVITGKSSHPKTASPRKEG